jgi:branched-chain amino acid transport system substrate-binding protein
MTKRRREPRLTRRQVMRAGGAIAAATALGVPAIAAGKVVKLGYVSPQTGPLAPFGEADSFVLAQVRETFKGGVKVAGRTMPVEIVVKDSQSNPNRAAEVAADLINNDQVDLMLVASTPETTNPVSDQCEVNEVPCISSVAPWQPWFFARGGKPETGFKYTYHFFWGLEDVIAVYTNMWKELATDKVVGGLFPNDGDGNAWGDKKLGFPPVLDKEGYKLIDPGRFQNLTDNFSAQIAAFRQGKVEIVTGVVIPPDWTTFWTQANQQGFKPKIASVGKALLFPSAIEALGDTGQNLSTEVWWTPSHPFKSSLTGQSARQLADAYTAATKKQWTQPIGFAHALFEVAADVVKRAKTAGDRGAILDALVKTDLETIVGPIAWGKGPVKNVAKTPLVGGQWRRGGAFKYDLVITSNKTAPSIPAGGKMEPIA